MCVKKWQVARLEKLKTAGQKNRCSTSNVELHLYVPLAPGPKSNPGMEYALSGHSKCAHLRA